jgi:hypothetical protein
MNKILLLASCIILLVGCTNENIEPDDTNLLSLQGRWELLSVTGGFHGGGYEAEFDEMQLFFQIDSVFALLKNDTLFRGGDLTFQIIDSEQYLFFSAVTDDIHPWDVSGTEKRVSWIAADTLKLTDRCLDCYDYLFARILE